MTDEQDLITRLHIRAEIRLQADSRRGVQEGKPDRLAALLQEAADRLEEAEALAGALVDVMDDENDYTPWWITEMACTFLNKTENKDIEHE